LWAFLQNLRKGTHLWRNMQIKKLRRSLYMSVAQFCVVIECCNYP